MFPCTLGQASVWLKSSCPLSLYIFLGMWLGMMSVQAMFDRRMSFSCLHFLTRSLSWNTLEKQVNTLRTRVTLLPFPQLTRILYIPVTQGNTAHPNSPAIYLSTPPSPLKSSVLPHPSIIYTQLYVTIAFISTSQLANIFGIFCA